MSKSMIDEYGPANYEFWLRKEGWSIMESACLLLGVEPPEPIVEFDSDGELIVHGIYGPEANTIVALWHDSQHMDTLPERTKFGVESYFNVYDIIAWAKRKRIRLPGELKEASEGGAAPEWILAPAGGNNWRCGPLENSVLITGTRGITDFIRAVKNSGQDLNPASDNVMTENQADIADRLKYSLAGEEIDPTTKAAIENKIESLLGEIEEAKESGDLEIMEDCEAEIEKLQMYVKSSTRPGGKSRTFAESDPYIKGMKALRNGKKRFIDKLRAAGLDEVADHVQKCFATRSRSYAYVPGPPNPKWAFDLKE